MPKSTRRPTRWSPSLTSAETLGIRMDPHLVHEFARWAEKAGTTRSALGRMVIEQALARFRKNGRSWLSKQVAHQAAEGETAVTSSDVCMGVENTGRAVAGHDSAPLR